MKIFTKIFIFLNLLLFSINSMTFPLIYGRVNISGNYNDLETIYDLEGLNETSIKTDNSDLVSNASRFGIYGEIPTNQNFVGIYQVEYEAISFEEDPSVASLSVYQEKTFKQRNTFIGMKGNFGTIRIGTYDTPLKLAQLDADLFNDLIGDIKTISAGENRNKSSIGYDSPQLTEGLTLHLSLSKEGYSYSSNVVDGNVVYILQMTPLGVAGYYDGGLPLNIGQRNIGTGKSLSLKYDHEKIKLAVASERGSISGFNHNRLGMMIPSGPVTIGLIYTTSKTHNYDSYVNAFDYDAITISLKGNLPDNKGQLKFQYSDSKAYKKLNRIQFGYDYKFSKNFKVFAFYTKNIKEEEDGNPVVAINSFESTYYGIGLEYRFSYLFGK